MKMVNVEEKTSRLIDTAELSRHNTRNSAWVAVRGKVYDITSYLHRHPGGIDVLLFGAGRDVTTVFETYHDLDVEKRILFKFCIGKLVDNELPVFPSPSPFFRTLKDRVKMHLLDKKMDSKLPPTIWTRYTVIYTLVFLSWYWQFFVASHSFAIQVLCALTLGFFCAQIGLHPLHDASHAAATHDPWTWRFLGASHDFLNGCSYVVWIYQHLLGHHPYTNIAGADPDILTSEVDVRRIKPSQSWLPRYINQERFVPFLYGVLGIKTRLQDISLVYFVGSNDRIRINPLGLWHTAAFWLGKAFFVFYRFLVPVYIAGISWSRTLLLFALADAVSSYWLALTFQANHVVMEASWPLPNKNNEIDADWAVMQIATTQDYAHDSKFWTISTGALNYQAVHHLFPQVHQAHYPEISKVVRQICKEFNVNYLLKDDFWSAIKSHLNHLHFLGLGDSVSDIKAD